MKYRKSAAVCAACLMLAGTVLSACSTPELTSAYSFAERPYVPEDAESGFGTLFASDLCVVMDEGAFSENDINSEAGALFDLSGKEVLYSKNAFEQLYPASITKVMTALVALKYGDLSDQVTVTEDAVITEAGATLCGINPGDVLTLEQLLYGLMLPSGNDAGSAIAVHIAGSEAAFASLMNEEAAALGATGTHFVNPHGLTDPEHYTTAYDLYLIFQEAMKYPEFRQITQSTAYTANYTDGEGRPVTKTWEGGNWYMVGKASAPEGLTVVGGKTGTTSAAGFCLIMATEDPQGGEYVSVILRSGSREGLYQNMTKLISKIVE